MAELEGQSTRDEVAAQGGKNASMTYGIISNVIYTELHSQGEGGGGIKRFEEKMVKTLLNLVRTIKPTDSRDLTHSKQNELGKTIQNIITELLKPCDTVFKAARGR